MFVAWKLESFMCLGMNPIPFPHWTFIYSITCTAKLLSNQPQSTALQRLPVTVEGHEPAILCGYGSQRDCDICRSSMLHDYYPVDSVWASLASSTCGCHVTWNVAGSDLWQHHSCAFVHMGENVQERATYLNLVQEITICTYDEYFWFFCYCFIWYWFAAA